MAAREPRGLLGAYGSLGTYHTTGKRGSPVTDLRSRAYDDNTSNSSNSMNRVNELNSLTAEQGRTSSSLRSGKSPFKAGSLEASPRDRPQSFPRPITPPKPPPSFATSHGKHHHDTPSRNFLEEIADQKGEIRAIGRPDYSSRKRESLNALPQQALRTPSLQNESAIASSASSSPRPAPVQKYSSSFNRPPRQTQGSGRSGESGGSSGPGGDTPLRSSDVDATSDESIASFLGLLEGQGVKNVDLSRPSSRGGHSVNLARYSQMRDPNTQLAEEMSASSLIQASSTPPSRRLSNVPGLSTSSSPSRALAHTPHVRSRLSTHSIAEETRSGEASESPQLAEEDEDEDEPFIFPINEA